MRVRRACAIALIIWSAACGGGGIFRQYEYEEEIVPLARRVGDDLRQQLDCRAERAARHLVRDEPDHACRSRAGPHVFLQAGHARHAGCGRRAGTDVGSCTCGSRSTTSGGWPRWRRSPGPRISFERSGNVFVYRQAIGPPGGKATAVSRLDRPRARRLPPASAEQDRGAQHAAGQPQARQHPRCGSSP